MEIDTVLYELLGLHYYRTVTKLVVWGMLCLLLLAIGSFVFPAKLARLRIACTATCLWLGIFCLVYVDEYTRSRIAGVRLGTPQRAHRLGQVYPAWFLTGVLILWAAYGLHWWIAKRRKAIDARRGFPIDPPEDQPR